MELSVEKTEFFRWLSRIQNISEKRSTMPILAYSLLRTEGPAIHLYATDLEVGLHGVIQGEIKQPGEITIPSKRLFDIIRELPNAPVSLRLLEQSQMEVKCGKSLFTIMTLPSENYPPFPTFETIDFIAINPSSFLDMIEKTIFAVAAETARYNLSGVLLEKTENGKGPRLRMVATDGHRLAFIDKFIEPSSLDIKIQKKVIISRKGILEIKRLLEEGDTSVLIGFDEKSVVLKSHNTTLMARLMEGDFPDYLEVVPKSFKRSVQVDRKLFAEALRRVSVLSSEKNKAVKFTMTENMLKLTFSDPDIGEAKDDIEVIRYEGDPLEIGFNGAYFLELCNILDCNDVTIKLNDSLNPGVVFIQGQDTEYTYVAMPIMIV